ncbi:L-threonylcarbamoyladenylate synthase [uncultured Tessaracoccus sp.]|uniref:L-threonylcarbamoyladenylate synthase n=1 Tax=uncultured Tessaracoccus sp. TaxID=905023 RepID=UPI0026126A42|nr:L-threonylcarbamoyladenylate synthase [uncultured Tessaracoccus sp.]
MSESFDLGEAGFDAAVTAIGNGATVVFPTDTVYGIGADPFSADAVQALLDAKHRGQDMPPPVLIAEPSVMRALVAQVPDSAKELARAFWPGPLTLILDVQKSVHLQVGETRGTLALRVPNHDGARELLRRTGPLAVSSANLSGQPSATNCADALEQLGESVAVYLDGGPTPGPEPSTIVDCSSDPDGVVLRLGKLSLEQLQEAVPSVHLPEASESDAQDEQPVPPDQEPDESRPESEPVEAEVQSEEPPTNDA